MALDLFGNEIQKIEQKPVQRKIISKNKPVEDDKPISIVNTKKTKEKKVKEKPAKKAETNQDGMSSYLGAWHGILLAKLLQGNRYHTEGGGYHYFEQTEDMANIRAESLKRNGISNVVVRTLSVEISSIKKQCEENAYMFRQVRVYYEKKMPKK